ncbi:MAG: leukotoxin LktA family filamentous adhesin [Phascolarctobacterium sp.]|nr:leukotoxin LktA family filamentous adhesin [Phascolarctobacterium sp.]
MLGILATGMVAWPSFSPVYAETTITRTDGGPAVVVDGNVHKVYAGQAVGNTGVNRFSDFNIGSGHIANLYFGTSSANTAQFNTLMNFVNNRININGTVNAIRGSGVGGHLFFLSPNGMVVGASGAINTGSLTVMTPTNAWWNNKFNNNVTQEVVNAVSAMAVPINASGTIAIQGKMNATDDIRIKAGKINIGMDENDANKTAAALATGVTDFSSVVNMNSTELTNAGVTNLTAVRTANSGDIELKAEVSYNENTDAANKTVKAIVNVDGNSTITAARNANITAKATNNVKDLTVAEFEANYKAGWSAGQGFGCTATTIAEVNITKGTVEAQKIVLDAYAEQKFANSYSKSMSGDWGEKLTQGFTGILVNGVDVCVGDLTNKATVNVGTDAVLTASSTETDALKVNANAIVDCAVGTQAMSLALLGTLYSQNFDFFPSVNVNSVHVENEATVNLNGTLTAEKSNIAVEANAKDTLTSTASTGLGGIVLTSGAVFNFGFNKVGGSNTSNITVGEGANLTANKGISLYSDATTALNMTTDLATNNQAVTAFVINYLDYANISNVNIKGDITSDTGNIVVNSLGTYTENTFSGSASAGASFLGGIVSDGLGNNGLDDLVTGKFKNWMSGNAGNRNALLAQIFAELDNEGLGLGDVPGENPLPPGEIGDVPAEEQGKSFKEKVADMFKLGLSFGYMKEANKATVTVGKDAKINAKTGNLTVNAVTDMKDIYTAITGATKNPQEYPGSDPSNPTVLANGAIFLRTLDYDASIILEGGAATDTTLKTMDAKTISLTAEAKSLYKRINKMVDNIKKFSGVSEADFKASLGDLSPAEKEIIWQAYKSVRDNQKLKDLNKVYDANGNLKPEYTNGSEEYQAVINMVRKLQEEESVKKFNEFLDTGKFTYTDQSGISHTIDMQEHGGLKGFFTQLLLSAFAFLSPASYVNYNLASSTSGRDDSAALAVNVGVGLDHVNNNARVMVGSSREVASTEGNVNIKAITDYGNLDLDGTYYPTTGGGSSFSGGVVVGIHHLNNNSIVAVAESANLNAKKDLSAQAETDVLHIGLNVGMGMAKKNVLTGSINLVSADSNSIISIDDEAVLNAINLQMGGYNRTTSVAVTGGFVMGGTSATGAAVSVVSVKRNNILGIMDNDSVGTMSLDDAKYKSDDETDADDDEKRQKKVLRKFSGLTDAQRTAFFGTATEKTGSVTVRTLDVGTVTMGNIYSIDADVSLILNGNGSAPGIGSKIGTAFTNLLNKPRNLISNMNAGLMQLFGLNPRNIAPFPTDNEPTNPSEGVPLPKLAFTGIGSVGVNNVDAKTAVVLDKAKITFDKNSAAGSNVLKMFAFDDSTIVVASGGATGNTSEDYIGTGGDKACFTGGAAVNLVNNSVHAIIEDSTIDNADEIKNLAEQDGALGAGGLAINVTKETGGLASTYSLVGGVSVNIGNYNTMALLKNNTVNANPERTNKTNIINRATNKSLQVTAGLDINANQSYGTGIGIGAVFGWGIVHNATVATMHQGNYTQMGAVSNNAITDMTEISGVVGIGVEDTVSGGGFQGAVGINKFDNDVQALVQDVTLTGDSLTVYAYDTTLEKSDEYKKYDKEGGENKPSTSEKLKKLRFDTTGDGYFKDAKKGADQESDTEFLKKHGNSIVTAAVEIQAVTGAGANAAIGAAVVLNDIDNDFTTEISGSTLTLTGGVNVKAESTTRAVGVAAGGTGTSYGVAGAGSATIGMLNNDVISKVVNSTIKTTNLVVDAFQRNTIVNVAGQVAVGNKVIGLTWAYNYMNTFTGAYLNNTSVSTKDDGKSKASVTAEDDALLYAVAVSAVAATAGDGTGASFGGNGAVGINLGHNNVEAVATTDSDKVLKLTDFTVHSKDTTDLRAGAGGLNIGNAKVAIGGAVAVNRIGSLKVLKRDADGNIIYDAEGKAIVIEDNVKQSNLAKVEGYTLELGNKLDVKAEDAAKFTTVGVGCGLGTGTVAIQGADATTKLDKTTTADVADVNINNTGDNKGVVSVIADTNNSTKTIGIVGQLKFGDKPAVSIGMGTSQNLFSADTEAKLRGGTYKLDDLLLKSTSLQTIENDTIGGGIVKDIVSVGGSVTVNKISNNTKSLLGEVGKDTTITANNNVGVISQSDEDVDNYTGEVKVGLGNFASMGTSIASNDVTGDTIALVKNASVTADGKSQTGLSVRDSANGTNITFTGLVVDADAKHDFFSAVFTANLSAGYNSLDWDDAGGKIVSVGASATINTDDIKGTTKAAVEDSDVNKDRTENLGNVTVKATDYIYQKTSNTNAVANIIFGDGVAISLGGGISVNKDVRTIDAHIDGDTTDPHSDKKTVNANILKVLANSKAQATLTNTAATVSASALGSGGVNVGVTYLKMDETTNATIGNVKTKNNGMSVNAKHVDDITLYATTVTVCGSYIGVGIGTHVATVDNFAQTNALVDNSEVEHYSNNTAEDEVKADSDSTTHTQSNNTAVSISLGAGVGVLVANNNLQQTVSAVVKNSNIGKNDVRAKKADILSNNIVTTRFNNQNIAGSAVAGIGVGVGTNKVDTAVRSDVAGSAIYSAGDISIKAEETKNINGTMVAATVGGISTEVSVLHNYISLATVGEDYTDLNDFTKVNEKMDDVTSNDYDAARVESITSDAKTKANTTLQNMREKTAVSQSETDNTTIPTESGTGGGSNKNVAAGKEGVQTNVLQANLYATNKIDVLSKVHTDTNTTLGGGGLGVVNVNVELNNQHVKEKVGSTVTDGLMQTEKGDISVQAVSDGELKNDTIQIGALSVVGIGVTKSETLKQGEGLQIALTNVNMQSGKDLDIKTSDKLAVLNKVVAVNVGGLTAAALTGKAEDNASSKIYLNSGTLQAHGKLTVEASSTPKVKGETTAVEVSAVQGSGMLNTVKTSGNTELTVGNGIKIYGNTVDLGAKIYKPSDGHNLDSDVHAVGVSVIGVSVDKSRTISERTVKVSTGYIDFTFLDVDPTKPIAAINSANIYAIDGTDMHNYIRTTAVGVIASESNFSQSTLKNKVSAQVDTGTEKIKGVDNLQISATSSTKVNDHAKASSGSTIGIMPYAAQVENKIDNDATLTIKGNYEVGSAKLYAEQVNEMQLCADSLTVTLAGGSGTRTYNDVTYDTTTNITGAKITATNGDVRTYANTLAYLNKLEEVDPNKKFEDKNANCLVLGNGVGGFDIEVAKGDNKITFNDTLNITNSTITGAGDIILGASSNGILRSQLFDYTVNAIGGGQLRLYNTINSTNKINYENTIIRGTKAEKDVTISASDGLEITAATYTEMSAGAAGATEATTNSTVDRKNTVNLTSGEIYSMRDVNLYSGKDVTGNFGLFDYIGRAETYCGALVPFSTNPTLNNTLKQNNEVNVETGMKVMSVRHSNLYGDNGREHIKLLEARHSMWRDKTNKDVFVASEKGDLSEAGEEYKNYVKVDGSITAGISNIISITIGETGMFIVADANEKNMITNGGSGYTVYTFDEFKELATGGLTIVADESAKITKDKFQFGVEDFISNLSDRVGELKKLKSDAEMNADKTLYNAYAAELDRVVRLKAKMENMVEGQERQIYDAYISIPDLAASGGNVNVDSGTFYGGGAVTAKGTPSITITNNTNLELRVNNVIIDDPGGLFNFNNNALSGTSAEITSAVAAKNKDTGKSVNSMTVIVPGAGTVNELKIEGNWAGSVVSYGASSYTDDKGQTVQIDPGTMYALANIEINGNINSKQGVVNIYSAHNDIIVEGRTAKDSVNVRGKEVHMNAPFGSITQGFTKGIVSIGGNVQSQFSNLYGNFITNNKNKGSSTTTYQYSDGSAIPFGSGRIDGGEIYLNALDININGILQSGYEKYFVNIDSAAQAKIDNLKSSNKNSDLSDVAVLGNPKYCVVEGKDVAHGNAGYFDRQLAVYYNPATDTLLVENVDASGGKIYLSGRISSTGSALSGTGTGAIYCMDGAYNIDITNQLPYDLKTNSLVVNDVSGLVQFTNLETGVKTQVTRDGIKYFKFSQTEGKEVEISAAEAKTQVYTNNGVYFKPTANLRYTWSTGYALTNYQDFYKEFMAKWWGLADGQEINNATLLSWSDNPIGQPVVGASEDRPNGETIAVGTGSGQVSIHHDYTIPDTPTTRLLDTRRWTTGYLGCHKRWSYTWRKTTGTMQADTISVKADNNIGINFIGSSADNSYVKVQSTNNGDIILAGNTGNMLKYTVTDKPYIEEKGKVIIDAQKGSVLQKGGSIYGTAVELGAVEDINISSIVNGHDLTLSANVTQGGSIDITAKDRIGASAGDDISNIKIAKFGGVNVDTLNLRADGNIVQQANAPVSAADRINLTSTLGGVYGENNSYFRLQGGQQIVGGDSLSASVNVTASKDIRVQQTSGDLRIGKFHTDNGDVYISVPQGGIVDALPYVERTPMEENELLDLWKSMGMIEGGDSDLNADKNKALANTNGTVYENYCAGVQEAFSRFTTISAKPEADRTQAEKDTLAVYQKQFKTPDSPDDSPAYFASAADFLAQDTQAAKLAEIGQTRQETYKVWDKDLLLYQIDDAIVNHHAGVVLPEKDPNIFGKNINISVQNGVGLNSDKVTEINMEHLDKNSLKFLSQVDPSTVTWKTNESNESIAVITDRLAIGLQQSGVGSINITTAGNAKSNVFLENRLDDTLNLADPYKNLDIAKILAGAGNVTVTSLGSIYDVNTLTGINANGYATVATISGNNVMLMTGAVGTNNGNIGMAGNFIRLNMSGNLTATATGNIYLEQAAVNGSAKNLNILTMTAGVDGQSYSTTSGNIYLKAAGNIYSVVQDSRVQGYIRSDSHGQISFDAVGNIGYAEKADGSIDFTKTIRFKNSTVEAEVVSGEVQAHDTVKLHSTAGSINVEGVSTATIDDDKKQAAGGYFNLVELSGTLDNVVITQNGTFNLKNDVEATGAFILNINEYADIGKSIKAKNIIINATSSIELADGIILKAETVTLSTDKVPDLTYGTIADSLTSGGLIAQGATNNYDDVSGKMHFEAGGNTGDVFSTTSAIQANELQATASQGIFLGGKNDCNNVALYNAQNSVVYHNVADVDPNETGDVLTVGVLDFLHTSGSDAIVGSVWIYNEAKTETAASGQLTKPMAVTSGVYAVNDIDLKSNGDLVNQYEIESIQGSVYLEAGFENGGYVKEGNLENYGSISTGNEGNNEVEIYATGKLHNHAEGLNGEGNYICGVDGVKITAYKDVINDAHLYALTGDVTVGNNASGTGIEPGKVVNNGNIYVGESGDIQLNSGFTLFNSGVIYSNRGAVNLFAQNSMENTGDIYSVQGDVALQSYIDGLQSTGNIFSGNGSVTLKAKETIKNTGDMFVHGNGSKVTMLSENKDIVNTDDLLFNSDVFKSLTGIEGPTQSIYAYGGIEFLAEQGNLYNSKELKSHGDIVLKAKGDIIIESDPGLDDAAYLDETSSMTRIKNIKTTGGKVTIKGRNVINNMTVEADKGITVKATADRDTGGSVVAGTGIIKVQGNNGHYKTNFGDVKLEADGYWENSAYEGNQKFSISNGGVNDLIAKCGDIILKGEYSVENVGDIIAKKGEVPNRDESKGNASLTSVQGNIYNYEYADESELDFDEKTLNCGTYIGPAVKPGVIKPRAIDVEGSITWTAIKVFNKAGQYSGNDVIINVVNGGSNHQKIKAGRDIIVTNVNNDFSFAGSLEAGGNIILKNTNGSFTILNGASVSAGGKIDINAGAYVDSGIKIEAGQGVSVYSENGYVKLDNGITANDGLIRVYSQNDTAATGATTHNVEIGGTLYSANGSINISTNSGGIQAENMLAKDLAAVASLEGNVKITGNTKGQKVTFYTEDEAAELTFNKVQFGDEIIMAANGGEGGRSIDMSNVEAMSDNYKMGLYGAGRTKGNGNYTLDYEGMKGNVTISHLNGDIINIVADGEVKIDNVCVSKESNIFTMGTKTKIYGKVGPTDAASNVIYYAPGGTQSIDLHEVFFDDEHITPVDPENRNPSKYPQVQRMMEDSSQFTTNYGNGKGMRLHIVDSSLQYGNGTVLMDTYGSDASPNRYSATDTMIFLENMKAHAQFDNYFNIGFNFYERYNNIYIPDVTVNSIALTNKGMENNGIVIVPAKDSDEYEF